MTKMDEKLVVEVVRFLDQNYRGTLFATNCRIEKRFFELLYYTKSEKFVEVRLVLGAVSVQRMITLMGRAELRPDHLYLIVQEQELLDRKLIPPHIGVILLENNGLRLIQKSRKVAGRIPRDVFFKRVSDTVVGLFTKLGGYHDKEVERRGK